MQFSNTITLLTSYLQLALNSVSEQENILKNGKFNNEDKVHHEFQLHNHKSNAREFQAAINYLEKKGLNQ